MKRFALSVTFALIPATVLAGSENWTFVQATGGISVATPTATTKGWLLPVHANVSGLETITVKPTALNSALVCERTDATVEGQNIFLTIVSGPTSTNASTSCPPSQLGNISPGKYKIFYRGPKGSPVQISEISIGL